MVQFWHQDLFFFQSLPSCIEVAVWTDMHKGLEILIAQDVEFFLLTLLCINLGFYCCDQMSSLDQPRLYMFLILGS